MSLSFWQVLIVVVLFVLLFGRGKVPQLMSDLALGIKNFKTGMREIDEEATSSDEPKLDESSITKAER
ncbi:twin-arginine translocase TatA/TatE family subunit [Oceanicoccus sp. KOV_DT_Chl]|uniref:twin-arginine translocase TatA/TatE family subunit n=1 Tax=Oceanicoccus sp. KOV_DT_Chl TaxID=1904639 RepID=UPI000C7B8F79|nr:twin-arginine translocase TatA/TatE family subunit [Oceanicoccus sp. KOV_DT_Chl]